MGSNGEWIENLKKYLKIIVENIEFKSARLNQKGELTLRLKSNVPVGFKRDAFKNQTIALYLGDFYNTRKYPIEVKLHQKSFFQAGSKIVFNINFTEMAEQNNLD